MAKKVKKVAKELAALKAEVANLKTEMAHLRVEQSSKLKVEIDNLHEKLHAELEQAKQGSRREEKEAQSKVHALEEKAAKVKGEAKAAIEARMTNIRNRSKKSTATTTTPASSSA